MAQHVREGRFQRSVAALAAFASVLSGLEVTYQHYRGSYGNELMYTPVALTPPLVAAGITFSLRCDLSPPDTFGVGVPRLA